MFNLKGKKKHAELAKNRVVKSIKPRRVLLVLEESKNVALA